MSRCPGELGLARAPTSVSPSRDADTHSWSFDVERDDVIFVVATVPHPRFVGMNIRCVLTNRGRTGWADGSLVILNSMLGT